MFLFYGLDDGGGGERGKGWGRRGIMYSSVTITDMQLLLHIYCVVGVLCRRAIFFLFYTSICIHILYCIGRWCVLCICWFYTSICIRILYCVAGVKLKKSFNSTGNCASAVQQISSSEWQKYFLRIVASYHLWKEYNITMISAWYLIDKIGKVQGFLI